MSTSRTARRTVALFLATAGLLGGVATTASAHSGPSHSSRVEITRVDPGSDHHHRHGNAGRVTLTNEGRRTENLNHWMLCDQDWNCTKIRGVYLKGDESVTLKMRDLTNRDRFVFLFNDHGRIVDVARVPHHHHHH